MKTRPKLITTTYVVAHFAAALLFRLCHKSTCGPLLIYGALSLYATHSEGPAPILARWPILLSYALVIAAMMVWLAFTLMEHSFVTVGVGAGVGLACFVLPLCVRIGVPKIPTIRRLVDHAPTHLACRTLARAARLLLIPASASLVALVISALSPFGANFIPYYVFADLPPTYWLSNLLGPTGRLFVVLLGVEALLHTKYTSSQVILAVLTAVSAAWTVAGEQVFASHWPAASVALIHTCDVPAVSRMLDGLTDITLVVPIEEMCEPDDGQWRDLAVRHNTTVVNGYEGEYNILEIFLPDGSSHEYVKPYLIPSETRRLKAGHTRKPLVLDLPVARSPTGPLPNGVHDDGIVPRKLPDYIRVGFAVCNDAAFPYFMRRAAPDGADLLVAPGWDVNANWAPGVTTAMALRAAETGAHFLRHTGFGHSALVDPFGRWLFQATADPQNGADMSDTWVIRVPVRHNSSVFGVMGGGVDAISAVAITGLLLVFCWRARKSVKQPERQSLLCSNEEDI